MNHFSSPIIGFVLLGYRRGIDKQFVKDKLQTLGLPPPPLRQVGVYLGLQLTIVKLGTQITKAVLEIITTVVVDSIMLLPPKVFVVQRVVAIQQNEVISECVDGREV